MIVDSWLARGKMSSLLVMAAERVSLVSRLYSIRAKPPPVKNAGKRFKANAFGLPVAQCQIPDRSEHLLDEATEQSRVAASMWFEDYILPE
ncbi:MAG: hypothetical protein PVG54_17075, partial [Anaerolineae bacterium]